VSSRPSRGAARLAAILDALPDALVLVNANGTVVNANTIALEAFEAPGTALVGRGLLDLLPEFDSRLIPGSMRRPDHIDPRARTKPTRMMARRTDGTALGLHVSTALPGTSHRLVELRRDGASFRGAHPGERLALPAGGEATLCAPYVGGTRLWLDGWSFTATLYHLFDWLGFSALHAVIAPFIVIAIAIPLIVVTVLLSFVATWSKVVLATVAVLVTLGAAAAPTATVSVIAGRVAPLATGPAVVQVTAWPEALHVQPVPVPETYVSPEGKVSLTVMGPLALCGPLFVTLIL